MLLDAERPGHAEVRHVREIRLAEEEVRPAEAVVTASELPGEREREHRVISRERAEPAAVPEPAQVDGAGVAQFAHQLPAEQPPAEHEEEIDALATELEDTVFRLRTEHGDRVAVHDKDDSKGAKKVQT